MFYSSEELQKGLETGKLFNSQLSSVPVVDFNGTQLTDAQRVHRYNDLRAF
jgi:hypothetical protein